MNKNLNSLFKKISFCQKCTSLNNQNGRDCSLINFYHDEKFYLKIPSIWTDWNNRINSNIMIIGQDWGPYQDMVKLNKEYLKEETIENWKYLIECEKSNTKKMLTKYLQLSAKLEKYALEENFLDNMYITNAILCARKGTTYRGDNICLKESTKNCANYLREQIEIINPKVIITLGYYPLYSLSLLYSFPIDKTLTETIEQKKEIKIGDSILIPMYHPTAQIAKEKQLEQYRRIWKYMTK